MCSSTTRVFLLALEPGRSPAAAWRHDDAATFWIVSSALPAPTWDGAATTLRTAERVSAPPPNLPPTCWPFWYVVAPRMPPPPPPARRRCSPASVHSDNAGLLAF